MSPLPHFINISHFLIKELDYLWYNYLFLYVAHVVEAAIILSVACSHVPNKCSPPLSNFSIFFQPPGPC